MVKRSRRATAVAGGFSLLVHASLFALLSRPTPQSAPFTETTVSVDLRAEPVEERPAPALPPTRTPAPVKDQARPAPRPRPAAHPVPRILTSHEHTSERPAPSPPPDTGEPDDEGEAHPAPAAAASTPPLAAVSAPMSSKAPVIAPDAARALRVYDTFPMLLAQAARTRAEVVVEVCVSDHGQVSDAVIAEGSLRAVDHTLCTAIRSWRYRPLVVNGAATPFCHFMRITYAMN